MLRRVSEGMLLICGRNFQDGLLQRGEHLQHPQHMERCRIDVAEVRCCTEAAYAQIHMAKHEQQWILLEYQKCRQSKLHLLIVNLNALAELQDPQH